MHETQLIHEINVDDAWIIVDTISFVNLCCPFSFLLSSNIFISSNCDKSADIYHLAIHNQFL